MDLDGEDFLPRVAHRRSGQALASEASAGRHAKIADLGEVGLPSLAGWRRSRSESPVGWGARVGNVGAIGTRADGTAEMLAELGMVLGDPGHRLADRARSDADAARRFRPPKMI
jgi:hypothetical protein